MKITKKQLKQLINEVAMGGVGPGFHGFNQRRKPQAPINEVEYYAGDLEMGVKEVMSILRGMRPEDRNPEIYQLIEDLEDLARRG